jgi:hypothetical protein
MAYYPVDITDQIADLAKRVRNLEKRHTVSANIMRVGHGVPAGTLGNVGDGYTDFDTHNLYEKTATTTWTPR